ncbi:unnamed protein product [Rotaria magnacalcarata]|uniref:FBA domain-containing protein n=1 Tax=Rotaria magnacalcarata TaxID=392030 RepID=A0A816NF74_9BILA|nr:unnamed protein product [Rotaria magnacalcarata]
MASDMSYFDRLPNELLEQIFLSLCHLPPVTKTNHVPITLHSLYFDYSIQQPLLKQTHTDLLSISLVCRRFYQILKSPAFWQQKCLHDYVLLPTQHFPTSFTPYEKLYINNPFHPSFNLIKENKWTKSQNTNSQVEFIPRGSNRLYDEFNRLSICRVTSYTWGKFIQRDIQLLSNKLSWNDIACLHPIIEFSVCVAPRWDCASEYRICLIFSDEHRWECERTFPQWNDSKWHRLTYLYRHYEHFPTSVTVHLSGKDRQGWAGFYGAKFAQTRIRLLFDTDENESNQENETIIEPQIETEINQDPQPEPVPDNLPIDDGVVHQNSTTLYSSFNESDSDFD